MERITIRLRNATLQEALQQVSNQTGLGFRKMNDTYLVSQAAEPAKSDKTEAKVQPGITIAGKVFDNFGDRMPGVAIIIRGTNVGTSTDVNGEFSIQVPGDTSVLQFRFIGYRMQEVVVGTQRIIAVTMQEATAELGEVTIVAFGTQKKQSVVASVETVNTKELKIASSNLTSAFAGKIPGMISYSTTGEPGMDNANFFIRGVTTFGYKSDPLILIDGFEATNDDLARMTPDDIESFSILKDAAATVLYGARGANGIIVVTTKGGNEGPVKVSARVDVNLATPTRLLKLLDGIDYMRLYNQALVSRYDDQLHDVNDVPTPPWYREDKIRATQRGENSMIYPNINWYDMLFKNSTVNTKANINLSGGGAVAKYYVAAGFDHQTGLLKVDEQDNLSNFNNNINIKRFNMRSNVLFKLSKTTLLDTRINGSFEQYNGPYIGASDIFRMVMDSNPVDFPAVWEPDARNEKTRWTLFGNADPMKTNPFAEMVKGYRERIESRIVINVTLSQDLDFITPNLKFNFKVSASNWNKNEGARSYSPVFYGLEQYDSMSGIYSLYNLTPNNVPRLGNVVATRDGDTQFYFEARLNWDKTWGDHSIGVMTVGIHQQKILSSGTGGSIYYTLPERNLGNSGRISYDYDKRYFAEFAYGYNGSEKFTKDKRFGFFPSYGAGWIVSNEAFWGEGLKNTISLLKFKLTYGKAGNDAIAGRADRFFYLSEIVSGGGDYQWGKVFSTSENNPGFTISRYANPDITWEVAKKLNLGMEIGIFKKEAMKIQFDVFKEKRENIYMARQNFPATAGFATTIHGNVGKTESKGIDSSIDYKYNFNSDFWLTGRVNFTYATNKYLELDEKNYRDEYRKRVGHPIKQTWGLVAERLFVDQLEIDNTPRQEFGSYMRGDIKYLDVNRDGLINSEDEVPMGFPTVPEMQYGFGISTGYKNFDLSFFFQGNARVSFYIAPASIAPFVGRRNAPEIIARDSWSETHPDVHAFWPRLATYQINNNTQQSSWWLRNGSFMRLKTLEIGYSLPVARKIHLQNLRVYFIGENLFTISAFKLWDPEMGGNGLAYPINRRFNIGCQFSF